VKAGTHTGQAVEKLLKSRKGN
jgi:hypothetical protein